MSYRRRSRFVFGTNDWTTELSAHPWIPADSTVGGSRTAASGIPAAYIVRRDALVELTLRVSEDEWPELLALVAYGQTSQAFLWYPDAAESESRSVYLESPLAGERWAPSRMPDFLRVFDITLTLRAIPAVDPWVEYFDDTVLTTEDTEIISVITLPTTIPSLPVGSGQVIVGQALNVSLQTIPGVVVTWSSDDPSIATVSGDMTSDGLVHTANVSGVSVGTTTIRAFANGIAANVVMVTVVAAVAGTTYWRDTQAGGVFAPFSGGYGWWDSGGGFYNPAPSVVADADSPTGFAVRFRFNPSPGGSRTEARLLFGDELTDVYIGWNIKFPLNYYHRNGPSSDNNKMAWVWGGAYSVNEGDGDVGLHVGFSAWPHPSTGGGSYFGFSKETRGRTSGDGAIFNAWVPAGVMGVRLDSDLGFYRRFIFHIKVSTGPGTKDGVVQLWVDGVLVWSKSDADLWDYSPVKHNYFDKMYLLGAANSGFNVVTDILVQDVAIGSTYNDVA